MSNEEIIRNWKSSTPQDPAQASDAPPASNPAGDTELDDEHLEKVSGGLSSEFFLSLGCCPGDVPLGNA